VAFEVETGGNSFRFGNPADLMSGGEMTPGGVPFAIHPDGNRIVHAGPDPTVARSLVSPIHLVTDWRRALAR
jgi:hypothetical protein